MKKYDLNYALTQGNDLYLTLDIETTNGTSQPLAYDIGGVVHDLEANVYATFSFLVEDIFVQEQELMKTAYYANKIPMYYEEFDKGINFRPMTSILGAKKYINQLCKTYNIQAIIAHNASFDYRGLNTTIRYVTKSKERYFLPYGIDIWDSLKLSRNVLKNNEDYINFCKEHNYLTKQGKPRFTAEILTRYITKNENFEERHVGLSDCLIEIKITCYCLKLDPQADPVLYARKPTL